LLQEALHRHGAVVYVDDPLFSEDELRKLGYTVLPVDAEGQIEAIILQADHQVYSSIDISRFANCRVLLDGRGALQRATIEKAGLLYIAIGDGQTGISPDGSSSSPKTIGRAMQDGAYPLCNTLLPP
jgi:hypothetical protein